MQACKLRHHGQPAPLPRVMKESTPSPRLLPPRLPLALATALCSNSKWLRPFCISPLIGPFGPAIMTVSDFVGLASSFFRLPENDHLLCVWQCCHGILLLHAQSWANLGIHLRPRCLRRAHTPDYISSLPKRLLLARWVVPRHRGLLTDGSKQLPPPLPAS